MVPFKIVEIVRLYVSVFLPKIVNVIALGDLPFLFKDLHILVLGSPLVCAKQQICFIGALRIAHYNFRSNHFLHLWPPKNAG